MPDTLGDSLLSSALFLLAFITLGWWVAYRRDRFDLVDIVWGGGFIVVTIVAFFATSSGVSGIELSPRTIVSLVIIVWAVRLCAHILKRFLRRPEEDVRYQELRRKWKGNIALNSYLKIFLLQAALLYIICLPAQVVAVFDPGPSILLWVGLFVWIVGFSFETIGDRQLAEFAGDPAHKGKLLTTGLWKYTRHPNYFGEVTQWWGVFLMTLPAIGINTALLWLLAPSPLLISYLILRVSGVPLTEKLMAKRDGWRAYASRTSKFLPLPPKKG